MPWLKTTLVQCASAAARKKASYLQTQFHRLRARCGAKKAIGAVAASILTAAYHMLKHGTLYEDLGPAPHRPPPQPRILPSKSPLLRQPPNDRESLPPPYRPRRQSHRPPDGGLAGAVPPASFVLAQRNEAISRGGENHAAQDCFGSRR